MARPEAGADTGGTAWRAVTGALTTGGNLDLLALARQERYGAEWIHEARRAHLWIAAEPKSGAAGVAASTEIASATTTITGKAAILRLDRAFGHHALGSALARFSLEATSGVRDQRTTVGGEVGAAGLTRQLLERGGEVGAAGFTRQHPERGGEVVLGAHAVGSLRVAVTGGFDFGAVEVSDHTWSTTADGTLRVASWVSVASSAGPLTMRRASANTLMHGPRVALQVRF